MLGTGVESGSQARSATWWERNPDVIVVLGWVVVAAVLGYSRREFTGDGVRHLKPILQFRHPLLGEPRWMLFPSFLFFLLRPFVLLGLATTVEGLTRPMMAATLIAAAVYLLSVRICLIALGFAPRRRALALLVAAFSGALFFSATDLMEPIFAAALVTAGLAFAARPQTLPEVDEAERRRRVLVAVSAIAAGSLLYQGVILAIGLIPLFVPLTTLRDRKTAIPALVILAAVPVITTVVLVLAGDSAAHAFGRFSQGEENPLYRSYLKRPGLSPYVVALLGGPPQGILAIPEFHGFNAIVSGLKTPGARRGTLEVIARLALGSAIVWGIALAAIRRRDYPLVIAFGILLALPLVRHQQYGYLKYYILLPVILAVGASRFSPRVLIPLIVVLGMTNGAVLIRKIRADRQLYDARAPLYAEAGPKDCWVTTGWGPAVSFKWPGSVCGVLGRLAGGSGNDPRLVVIQAHEDLTECLRECFCHSSVIYTDDMTADNNALLAETAQHFQYADVDLATLTLPRGQARLISQPAAPGNPVYTYAPLEQRHLCSLVSRK